MTKKAKKSILLSIILTIGVILFITMQILKTNVVIAEWWSINIAQHLVGAMARVSDLLPFSLFELFIIFAIILGILTLIVGIGLLVKHKFHTALNGLIIVTITVFGIANIYAATAEFQYYRAPLQLHTSEQEIELQDTIDTYEYFIKDFNNLAELLPRDNKGQVVSYSHKELSGLIAKEYALLSGNEYIYDYTPNAKAILNSWFMTDTAITGITFMPTGEANFNKNIPPSSLPHTLAHELAHTKGVMREGDANMLAYFILINSGDNYLRYCGYYQAWSQISSLVRNAAYAAKVDYNEINLTPLSPLISEEFKVESSFWANNNSFIGSISSTFNNLYLKLNGVINGSGSYFDNSTINKDVDNEGNEIITVFYSNTARMIYETYLKSVGLYTL